MKKEYPIIIALSAKKSGGKGESCKFLTKYFESKGKSVQVFSFAGPLKKLCVELLGLSSEQVYGSEEEKNSLTKYSWENLPHYPIIVSEFMKLERVDAPKGLMTARQILQEVGTGIFRRMYANIWNEVLLRNIKQWDGDIALVDDMRFLDEFKAVSDVGAITIRLTRNIKGKEKVNVILDKNRVLYVSLDGDNHVSETSLDSPKFDWNLFDIIIDNQDMDIETQNKYLEHAIENRI